MSVVGLLLGLFLVSGYLCSDQNYTVVPCDPVAFSFPCANDPALLVQTHLVHSGRNDWQGVFFLSRFPIPRTSRLRLGFEYPAKLRLKNMHGRVSSADNLRFDIIFYRNHRSGQIAFKVEGLVPGFYPHLLTVRFNGQLLCDNSDRDLSAPFLKKAVRCGKPIVGQGQGLISNSYHASPGAWPWHVAIFHRDQNGQTEYKCGGTLIDAETVLTGE